MQSRRAGEQQEQAERLPRALSPVQKKPLEPLASSKNNSRLLRSLRAWAALGTEALLKRQALPTGGTSLPA